MPTMNVDLSEDLQKFVAQQLENGGYSDQSDVVREALRLMRERVDKLRDLRAALRSGLSDVAAGKTKALTDELLASIADRGRRRASSRKNTLF